MSCFAKPSSQFFLRFKMRIFYSAERNKLFLEHKNKNTNIIISPNFSIESFDWQTAACNKNNEHKFEQIFIVALGIDTYCRRLFSFNDVFFQSIKFQLETEWKCLNFQTFFLEINIEKKRSSNFVGRKWAAFYA